ncbi:MAG: succinate dehydrogenase, cytochrome b556 subunit [Rhodospirillales bacterium]|nr:succinate dehydrogenase, cytochrome b556 subunit [Rhodospirillales bacterium]HIJ44455.1 succinate dehydrogenase, cytochrome b556 subunit [Rhodospirillaceae bacterium]MDP7099103.1 succinate dehydrogenase, cytochrome b556 subunit [Rhodospirillales bacterium]MDP7214907.1 succinate dehydrogenase, cytochrome b556 subunit [Rhodospirillales bacterium]HIJ46159.1 succinate dehydrogenase, cytochrome b556 subunit [Rhodospirillaceae bacterium]
MSTRSRPRSPHLQIYRPQITSILSIAHRLTGVVLAAAALLLTYWLASAAYGPESFARAQAFFGHWFGRLILFGVTFFLFYHLCNGIRHLLWDIGWGFELPRLRSSGVVVVVASTVLTVLIWFAPYIVAGKL